MPGHDAPFAIGSDLWPGISKLIEECGEVGQVAGKLLATGGESAHWDGTDLRERLIEEFGDLYAALDFVQNHNFTPDDSQRVFDRRVEKRVRFEDWHTEQQATDVVTDDEPARLPEAVSE